MFAVFFYLKLEMCKPQHNRTAKQDVICCFWLNFIRFKLKKRFLRDIKWPWLQEIIIIKSIHVRVDDAIECLILQNPSIHTQWMTWMSVACTWRAYALFEWTKFPIVSFLCIRMQFIIDNIRLPSLTSPTTFFKVRRKETTTKNLSPKIIKRKKKSNFRKTSKKEATKTSKIKCMAC